MKCAFLAYAFDACTVTAWRVKPLLVSPPHAANQGQDGAPPPRLPVAAAADAARWAAATYPPPASLCVPSPCVLHVARAVAPSRTRVSARKDAPESLGVLRTCCTTREGA